MPSFTWAVTLIRTDVEYGVIAFARLTPGNAERRDG
jgi:hypothetical protein